MPGPHADRAGSSEDVQAYMPNQRKLAGMCEA